jgi:hypothetical protein
MSRSPVQLLLDRGRTDDRERPLNDGWVEVIDHQNSRLTRTAS